MKNEIKFKGVQGFETILEFNPKDEDYRSFIDIRKESKKHPKTYDIANLAKSIFSEFIGGYIKGIGLGIGVWDSKPNSLKIYLRNGKGVEVYCEGFKILPGRADYLDGYEPNLFFTIPSKTNNSQAEIKVRSYLNKEGAWHLNILEDFVESLHSSGEGIQHPRVMIDKKQKHNGVHRICIASIEQIPKVLNDMKEIYKRIGEERFGELTALLEGTRGVRNNETAHNILMKEYKERLKLLLPRDL